MYSLYPVIGEPPSLEGAFHDTVIEVSVAASNTGLSVLNPGTFAQGKNCSFEKTEVPIALVAWTLKP